MRTLLWVLVGWFGVIFWTALGARLSWGHVIPDMAVITVVFLALNRDPIPLVLASVILGYLVGRQAVAPVGLHETGLVVCAIGVYSVAGHLVGSGGFFFAMVSGLAVMFYHVTLFLLVYWMRGQAGFSGWATALLLPSGVATFVASLLAYPFMMLVDRQLSQERNEVLTWR